MRRHREIHLSHALLSTVFCLFVTASAATEKEILLEFKGNITDDPRASLSSWVSSGNPCNDYNGVSCNSEGFVERIVLWNTSLGGREERVKCDEMKKVKMVRTLSWEGGHTW